MSGTQQYLFDHRSQVEQIEFEAKSLIAEGASPVSVVGATLWAAALVAEAQGMHANQFIRLVRAMVINVVEHHCPECDDDDTEGGAWGEA